MDLEYIPKDIQMIIYAYKHSAEMYDISQEFKRWFEIKIKDGQEYSCNLYGCAAFNFRTIGRTYYFSVFNMFQNSCSNPISTLCERMRQELNPHLFPLNKFHQVQANESHITNQTSEQWRQAYIIEFHL